MKLKTLSLLTGVLFLISVFVFINENKRGTDLLAGSDYIKGLDIGKVHKIVLHFKENKKITLTRDANKFVLQDHKSYPAASDKVNDLIYKIASIQVKEKVSSNVSKENLEKYELGEKSRRYLVELFDNDGKKTVSFRVGKNQTGKGNYLYKEGQKMVYVSKNNLWLNSSYKDFINTVLLDINQEDIEKVSLKSDIQIELAKKDKEFIVESHPKKKLKNEKAKEYIEGLSSIKFDDFFTPEGPETGSLEFTKDIEIQLSNKLIYKLALAKGKEGHFIKLHALVNEIPDKIVVRQDDGKEKLQNIENMVKAQGDAQRINLEKGRWVYKIEKSVYEKLVKDSRFFL